VLPALALASLGVVWLRTASLVRFSGVTGDILGAGEQITEIAVLTVVASVTWALSDVWWLG
jgi:cobalamin synthase